MKEPYRHKSIQHCVHSKNIYSLLDLESKDALHGFLEAHEKKCSTCRTELKKFKEESMGIKVYIAKPFMPKDMNEAFQGEISDLFKIAGLNERKMQIQKLKNKALTIDKFGAVFINNLFSEYMLKAFAFAALVFIGMRYFL